MTPAFRTIEWLPDAGVRILDQRELPNAVRYLTLSDAAGVAESIRRLAVRGAPAIGCAAAYGVAVEALRLRARPAETFATSLTLAFDRLAASRPTAVNLFWALERMRTVWKSAGSRAPADTADKLLAEAHRMLAADVDANRRMGSIGAVRVPDGARILTHCNAGALATAGHGTALGVIRSAVESGKTVSVFADETRPVLQGARLTAWELQQDGIPVTLLPDVAAGHLLAQGRIDLVIVGADRVAANGDVANKIGTYPLAVMARRHGIAFYVACPLSTIDLAAADGAAIPIEERPRDEVAGYGSEVWAPVGVPVYNPAFDVTPAGLVSALITEAGIVDRPDSESLRALIDGAL
ncbi:MAG: S-methyl-5-thioribose-1-phosphate isomerase [Betaproteobacteria bacterium]